MYTNTTHEATWRTSRWWQPDTALEFSEAYLLRCESSGIQESSGVMYLAPHPKRSTKMSNIDQRLTKLESRIGELKADTYSYPVRLLKDFAPLLTGLLISGLGLYATNLHSSRESKRQELPALQEAIPLLSDEDTAKRAFGYELFARFGERALLLKIFETQEDNTGFITLARTGEVSEQLETVVDKRFAESAGSTRPDRATVEQGAWVYLGHYDTSKEKWISKYFDLGTIVDPENLKGKSIKVLESVKTVNIRSTPPGRNGSLGEPIDLAKTSDPGFKVNAVLDWSDTGYYWASIQNL